MTLTPEAEVSSTVASNTNNSSDSDHSNETPFISTINSPTVIPPTTIVCLPTMVTVPNAGSQLKRNHIQTSYINASSIIAQKQHPQPQIVQNSQQQSSFSNKTIQRTQPIQLPQSSSQITLNQRAALVASSSSLPYLQLQTTQPLRPVPNIIQQTNTSTNNTKQPKIPNKGGRGSRTNSNGRPPPGAVNLERSYQICQAVIQNSPNRHQLKAQLRPPPSLLATPNNTNSVPSTITIKTEEITPAPVRTTTIYKVNKKKSILNLSLFLHLLIYYLILDRQCSSYNKEKICPKTAISRISSTCFHFKSRDTGLNGCSTERNKQHANSTFSTSTSTT